MTTATNTANTAVDTATNTAAIDQRDEAIRAIAAAAREALEVAEAAMEETGICPDGYTVRAARIRAALRGHSRFTPGMGRALIDCVHTALWPLLSEEMAAAMALAWTRVLNAAVFDRCAAAGVEVIPVAATEAVARWAAAEAAITARRWEEKVAVGRERLRRLERCRGVTREIAEVKKAIERNEGWARYYRSIAEERAAAAEAMAEGATMDG